MRLHTDSVRTVQPSIAFYRGLGAISMGEEWDGMRLEGQALEALDKLAP